ncbi:MAG: hypothetical protein K2Y20_04965 [Sphingomonas sp.]|nr:hypothetical protein [Sphingomonas sp.]
MDLPPPNYTQTTDAIVQCGISRSKISIRYEDELQSDEITISDLGTVSDGKLRCLKSTVHPFYILTIQNEKQRGEFYEFSEREDRPKRLADAREWLRSRGLLEQVPTFDPKQGIAAFAAELEGACGLRPGSALMMHGSSALTVRPEFILSKSFTTLGESLYCLTQMFAASNAADNGVRFVFIGNEAVSESNEK